MTTGKTEITCIHAPSASPPHGHYVHATVHNGVIYVCGLLGNSLEEHVDADRSMAVQVENCLSDLSLILKEANAGLQDVLQVTVYVPEIEKWGEVNGVWQKHFGIHKPARAVVSTPPLRYGSMVEIVAIAAVPN